MTSRSSSTSSSSSSDFADAVDTLAPLPLPPLPVASTSYAHPGRMDISAQSNRRNRLATLRSRMQSEFGTSGGSTSGDLAATEDEVSQSDRTSIASWGRNLLMERSNDASVIAVVCPADSYSTKATFNPTFPLPPSSLANLSQRPVPPPCFSPSSPPPTIPPPPLPDRINVPIATVSPVPSTTSVGAPLMPPPPLPPRRSTKPPIAITPLPPFEPEPSTVVETPKPKVVETKVEQKSVNNTAIEVKQLNHQPSHTTPVTPNSQETTPTEPPNTPLTSLPDNFGKKRGHAKTNSLDRGLTLAKSLKSGPWPPPSSAGKSSSLTRGVSPAEMLAVGAICEEDLAAQDVIDEILAEDKEPQQPTESLVFQPLIASKSAQSEFLFGGENTSVTPLKLPLIEGLNSAAQRYENLPELNQQRSTRLTETTPPTSSTTSSVPYEQFHSSEPSSSYFSAPYTLNSGDSSHSIDPITRDVQRRMSMKTDHEKIIHPPETPSSSGLGHAKSVVKNYGTIASGFFRGALNRARKSIAPGHNPPQTLAPSAEDDDNGSESDECAPSVSEPPVVAPVVKAPVVETEYICRPKNQKKGPYDFEQLRVVQELTKEHSGPVWVLKFSVCGRLLATAGQDNIVRVWVLKNHLHHFSKVRDRLNQHTNTSASTTSPSSTGTGDQFQCDMQDLENAVQNAEDKKSVDDTSSLNSSSKDTNDSAPSANAQTVMAPKPFCVFRGHTADVLDLSWSRNYFILSCGMDRTVKLWHLARNECLCCFQHMDFVTCIAFMPKDDRYFISGSMDGKIRLWHIPEKKVALWNEVEQVKFITAITFVKNGKFVVVGTYNGRCFFYTTDQLKYHTVIDVRSTRGKNARGHKITSLAVHGDKLLVTSNDSRIRMYDLRDMDMTCKFRGAQIEHSQIRASFSPDGKHIICGSEDAYVYLWRAGDFSPSLSVRKDRNYVWERAKVHNDTVTAAIFAPKPQLFLSLLEDNKRTASLSVSSSGAVDVATLRSTRFDSDISDNVVSSHGALSSVHIPSAADSFISQSNSSLAGAAGTQRSDRQLQGDVIVTADINGCIKILANPVRIKTGSSHFYVHD